MLKYFRRTSIRVKDWAKDFVKPALETRELTIPLVVLSVACFLLWKKNVLGWAEFGLNAFTEILGIIVTIVFVDQLIRQQELRRTLPLQAAAYEDVRILTTRIIQFWAGAFYQAVPQSIPLILAKMLEPSLDFSVSPTTPPSSVEQLFSLESINVIRLCLDLDSQPNVAPPRTWWEWLPQQEQEFYSRAERILERHAANLEPEAYALVHQLMNNFLHADTGMRIIGTIKQYDQQEGFPRPHNLAAYWGTTAEALETVVKLNKWCIQKKRFLEKNGIVELRDPILELNPETSSSPRCMIDPDKLIQSALAVQAYQEQLEKQKTSSK
ncbi:hypothetical protein [Gloeocapsopsis sp. IPPAS B-1203]|uniref:hypothetical protein n=1 Tax=Gloeocapsopsis sp. IPPAS B-1203 TaxID=2049454 RepID=UPI000C19A8C4|nr:hypothetical protein [Gloeocapsopsis sp. IPPAS B-1203]PIG90454.1 hypothetical protein CSQ79_26535 [Gloeocapsopsis sp. IPPAS B-1203]